jgi:hypothetical protein
VSDVGLKETAETVKRRRERRKEKKRMDSRELNKFKGTTRSEEG